MKKAFLLGLCLILMSIAGFAQKGYTYKFKINGLHDSVCYIGHYYGNNQYISKDTAKADAKGNLIFEGKTQLPGGVYVLVLPKKYIEFIVAEPAITLETDTANPMQHMKVINSKENALFYGYQRYMNKKGKEADSLRKLMTGPLKEDKNLKEQLEKLDKEVLAYQKTYVAENKGTLAAKLISAALEPRIPEAPKLANGRPDSLFAYHYFKSHYWDGFDFSDDRLARTPFYHNRLEKYFKTLVVQTPDSVIHDADVILAKAKASEELFKYTLWFIFRKYETSEIMGMDQVMVYLAEKYYLAGQTGGLDKKTIENIRNRVNILKPLLLGKKAPNLLMTDTSGVTKPLYNVQSPYTLVYFWDSECGHCRKETPILYKFYEKNKGKGIKVYSVNIERKPQGWKKYIRENKLYNWINVRDSNNLTDFKNTYDIYSTPVIYILDKDKKIIAKRLSVESLEDFFEKQTKKK